MRRLVNMVLFCIMIVQLKVLGVVLGMRAML